MPELFDQDETSIVEHFPGAEIVEAVPFQFPAQLANHTPKSAPEAELLSLLSSMPWIEQGDGAISIALRIATGDPTKAGEAAESRSPRNLKLVNKRHYIDACAVAISTLGRDNPRRCPVYFQVEAHWPDGELFQYSIGGWGPLGVLVAWHSGNLFPREAMIVEVESGQGNPAYRLQDA